MYFCYKTHLHGSWQVEMRFRLAASMGFDESYVFKIQGPSKFTVCAISPHQIICNCNVLPGLDLRKASLEGYFEFASPLDTNVWGHNSLPDTVPYLRLKVLLTNWQKEKLF